MPASFFPTSALFVKKALVAGIKTVVPPEVQVSFGPPGRDIDERWIFVGDVSWGAADWASEGNRQREESYSISLYLDVMFAGGTSEDAATEAYSYLALVADWIRENRRLSFGVSTQIQLVPTSETGYEYPGGMGCQIETTVSVVSRI